MYHPLSLEAQDGRHLFFTQLQMLRQVLRCSIISLRKEKIIQEHYTFVAQLLVKERKGVAKVSAKL